MRSLTSIIFYGNIFYGICALAMCIETNVQHHIRLNYFPFYVVVFLGTVVYYGLIYYRSIAAYNANERTLWYRKNSGFIKSALLLSVCIIGLTILFALFKLPVSLRSLTITEWTLIIIFPFVSFLYTSSIFPVPYLKKIRRIGWLKGFIVGFTWSGVVNVYPVLFRHIKSQQSNSVPVLPSALFWLQSFLFISALAVIFDIKDYDDDKRYNLRTFPALLGIDKTVRFVVIPLAALSLFILVVFLQQQAFYSWPQKCIQFIPYAVLLLVLPNIWKGARGVLFYLAAIDGLMLLKALCGIASVSIKF